MFRNNIEKVEVKEFVSLLQYCVFNIDIANTFRAKVLVSVLQYLFGGIVNNRARLTFKLDQGLLFKNLFGDKGALALSRFKIWSRLRVIICQQSECLNKNEVLPERNT